MALIQISEYRQYRIQYNDFPREFVLTPIDSDTVIRQAESQNELESKADAMIAGLKKIHPPLPAILSSFRGVTQLCKITSFDPASNDLWVSTPTGRSKESLKYVYRDNETNKQSLNQIGLKREAVAQLEKEVRDLHDQLEHITPNDFIKEPTKDAESAS